ncbi:MAG: hypothetical protein K9N48_03580 [Verrucomicrobia bacterium]|nr:hypothetical protein [Verrucomicrobiota bacterium]
MTLGCERRRRCKSRFVSWFMGRVWVVLSLFAAITVGAGVIGVQRAVIDASETTGSIRALHGANGGPIAHGGMIDLTGRHAEIGFPLQRMHDCGWPHPAVVDIHTIFRDFDDDPSEAQNYYFARTDDWINAVLRSGSRVAYRLGESIEHTTRKYDVHPPHDYAKWAEVCLGIIRHYNEGWADGFHYGIRYWEIWNEPDVRPQMWSGGDEDYYRLYAVTAGAIKEEFPGLKVGGPSVGNVGGFSRGQFEPAPFVAGFLEYCRANSVPLDFFTWHRYTDDPGEIIRFARGVREMLDRYGFEDAESHLNEWNYLPGNDWTVFGGAGPAERRRWYEKMGGAAGAAFTGSVLLGLQDAPVDMAYFYHSSTGGFGMFTQYGLPKKNYYAFKAFIELLSTPLRLETTERMDGASAVCAGIDEAREEVTLLYSGFRTEAERVELSFENIPWSGGSRVRVFILDAAHDLDKLMEVSYDGTEFSIAFDAAPPVLCLLKVEKDDTTD